MGKIINRKDIRLKKIYEEKKCVQIKLPQKRLNEENRN